MIDFSSTLNALPKHAHFQTLPARPLEQFITFHYSAVVYPQKDDFTDLARIKSEAVFQLNKDWGEGAFGDGLMYDYVVLSSGTVVKTRSQRQQLWHCGNAMGNKLSWAVHVMAGKDQDLTEPQRISLFTLFDQLRGLTNIPRQNVFGHCEWPRSTGNPVRTTKYTVTPPQSECPGSVLMQHIYAYRNAVQTRQFITTRPTVVMTDRSFQSKVATVSGTTAVFPVSYVFDVDDEKDGWLHAESGLGFIPLSDTKEYQA